MTEVSTKELSALRKALRQAALELDEAANIIAGTGLRSTASLFRRASVRALLLSKEK